MVHVLEFIYSLRDKNIQDVFWALASRGIRSRRIFYKYRTTAPLSYEYYFRYITFYTKTRDVVEIIRISFFFFNRFYHSRQRVYSKSSEEGRSLFFIIISFKIDPMIRGQSFGILSIRIMETAMLTARNILFTESV